MKKTLALLLVAIMAITCTVAALTVSAEGEDTVYTDKVNLLPASQSAIKVNGGTPIYELKDGKLYLTRDGENDIAWPSVVYDVDVDVDLSMTPYLHMNFETSGEGDRGVNGFIYYTVEEGGDELYAQISDIGGNGVDDFRDSDEMFVDLSAYLETTNTIHIVKISLSVYGGMGETIVWNTLAFAKEGADDEEEENTSSDDEENTSSTEENTSSTEENTSSTEENTSSTEENTSSTPAESDKVPTGDKGIVLFAVLGVVALAGVAVAVRVKH